jgi:quinol monooxygenase YgiN
MIGETITTFAQDKAQVVRMAKLEIDSSQLEQYKAMLKEGIETAVRAEPGVLTLYAVYEKEHPTRVTVFEVYADQSAYEAHLQTAHFKKYKTGTQKMVKHLELIEVTPISLQAKRQQ